MNIDLFITTLAIYSIFITNVKNTKKIACEHFNYESAGTVHNLIKKIFYKKMDAVVLLTHRDEKNYSFLDNTHVIPNSLSFEQKERSKCDNKEIISIGRLTEQKGFDLLIESAAQLRNTLPDWHISIYGKGPDKEKLLKTIENKGLQDYITIKNPVKDIQDIYLNASLYVSSSRWEGLPMVLLEAQSFGLPAVSYSCPNGPDEIIIENKTGYLVECFSTQLFADKITQLAKNDELRHSFSKAAKKYSNRFSSATIGALWESLINSLTKGEKK